MKVNQPKQGGRKHLQSVGHIHSGGKPHKQRGQLCKLKGTLDVNFMKREVVCAPVHSVT